MPFLDNLRNRLGDIIKPNRSFENLKLPATENNLGGNCSYVSSNTKFYPVHKTADSLADHPTFANTYNLIKNKILSGETFIKSDFKNTSKNLSKSIEEIGFDKQVRLKIFDILYKGCGAILFLVHDNQLKLIPFFERDQLVDIAWNRYRTQIISIRIKSEEANDHNWYNLDLATTDYFILTNIEESDTYKSNLTIAAPYIVLSNSLLDRDLRFANDDFNAKPIITPNIDRLVAENGTANVTIGAETMPYSKFLTSNVWGNIVKQINDKLKHDRVPILPFDVNIKSLAQSSSQNQTNLVREYAEDMITRACHSSGSILGKTGSNRAESEQQRDNFDQQVVKLFQDLICRVANDFLIPLFAPESSNKFVYQYYSEETDESIKLRDQQLRLTELLISPNFETFKLSNNLSLESEQITKLFNSTHGLKLIKEVEVVEEENEADLSDYRALRSVDSEELNEVFAKYKSTVNLSYSELKAWSVTDTSKLASLDRSPINRNLELLSTAKADWTEKHITWANKTIAFIARMKNAEQGETIGDTNWSKRDISLMNWAYKPNKGNRSFSFQDSIRKISIPTVSFNDLERNKLYQSQVIEPLSKALQQHLKSHVLRIDTNDVDKFLNKKLFQELLRKSTSLTTSIFEKTTGIKASDISKTIQNNIEKLTNLHFNGGEVKSFNSSGEEVTSNYAGYSATHNEMLAKYSISDLTPEKIKQLVNTQVQSFISNLFIPLFNETYETRSVESGASYVGTVAKNDQLVRSWHLANSNFAWKIGSSPPDNTNPEFYLESNCRCSRVYGTKEQLQKGGFKIFN